MDHGTVGVEKNSCCQIPNVNKSLNPYAKIGGDRLPIEENLMPLAPYTIVQVVPCKSPDDKLQNFRNNYPIWLR